MASELLAKVVKKFILAKQIKGNVLKSVFFYKLLYDMALYT